MPEGSGHVLRGVHMACVWAKSLMTWPTLAGCRDTLLFAVYIPGYEVGVKECSDCTKFARGC